LRPASAIRHQIGAYDLALIVNAARGCPKVCTRKGNNSKFPLMDQDPESCYCAQKIQQYPQGR
jgi:hypothetical protein